VPMPAVTGLAIPSRAKISVQQLYSGIDEFPRRALSKKTELSGPAKPRAKRLFGVSTVQSSAQQQADARFRFVPFLTGF
jgi:hypothetical protein